VWGCVGLRCEKLKSEKWNALGHVILMAFRNSVRKSLLLWLQPDGGQDVEWSGPKEGCEPAEIFVVHFVIFLYERKTYEQVMSDPLSITASIIAILQLSSAVVKYLKDIGGSESSKRTLMLEISETKGILETLKDLSANANRTDNILENVELLRGIHLRIMRPCWRSWKTFCRRRRGWNNLVEQWSGPSRRLR